MRRGTVDKHPLPLTLSMLRAWGRRDRVAVGRFPVGSFVFDPIAARVRTMASCHSSSQPASPVPGGCKATGEAAAALPRTVSKPPPAGGELSADEHTRRGDAAEELFRELVRRSAK